jgi:predicted enzyme related to lactoylglutathione lyase
VKPGRYIVDSVPTGVLHFDYIVLDVNAAHGNLIAAGVDFVMESTFFGDLKIAFCTDPSGVRIELIKHL